MYGVMALAQCAPAAAWIMRPLRQGAQRTIELGQRCPNSDGWRVGTLELPAVVFPRQVGHCKGGAAAARDHRASVLKNCSARWAWGTYIPLNWLHSKIRSSVYQACSGLISLCAQQGNVCFRQGLTCHRHKPK